MNWKAFKSVNALIVSFVLAGLLIGILVAAQFQSSVASNSFLADEINAQTDLMDSFDKDRVELKNQIASLRQQIEDNRQKVALTADQAKLGILDQLKEKLGLTKMRGAGLRMNLGDGVAQKGDANINLIHAADLRDMVNLLRTARVTGISINGQRLAPNSTINAMGNEVLVNKVKVVDPFEISVIGDAELIANRLSDQLIYPDLFERIKKKQVSFSVEKLNQVVLPAYDGDYLLKYTQNGQN